MWVRANNHSDLPKSNLGKCNDMKVEGVVRAYNHSDLPEVNLSKYSDMRVEVIKDEHLQRPPLVLGQIQVVNKGR